MLAGADIIAICGVLLVSLSSTPIAPWFVWAWMLAVLAALVLAHASVLARKRVTAAAAVLVLSAAGAIAEAPHQFTPDPPTVAAPRLYVVGDSISSGVGRENGPTWVRLIDQQKGVEVVDLSHPGATLASALDRVRRAPLRDGLVLLEIGGNDMFRHAPEDQFERDLKALLDHVSGPGRTVVMLELPLLPFHAELGRIQRRLAKKHGVMLIPKRHFASVLRGRGSTIDGLHLSDAGHRQMANMIWAAVGSSLSAAPPPAAKPARVGRAA
jgi:acyl-CoA thioesterase-1